MSFATAKAKAKAYAALTALALVVAAPAETEAAVVLTHGGTTPIGDTDGVVGLADIDTFDFTTLNLSLVYREIDGDITGGGIIGGGRNNWGVNIVVNDWNEILKESVRVEFTDAVEAGEYRGILPGDPFDETVLVIWQNADTLADGTELASIILETQDVGIRPDDDAADFTLTRLGVAGGASVFDPIASTVGDSASYDVQEVPLPAAGLLLFAAMLAIGAVRRTGS